MKKLSIIKKSLLTAFLMLMFVNLNAQTLVYQGTDGNHIDEHSQFGCSLSGGTLSWVFDILPWSDLSQPLDNAAIVNAEITYTYLGGTDDMVGTIYSLGSVYDEVMCSGSYNLAAVLGNLSSLNGTVYIKAELTFDDGTYECTTYTIEN